MKATRRSLLSVLSSSVCLLTFSARGHAASPITDFPVPTPASRPLEITGGSDGNIWFLETASGKIGRITPQGEVKEFAIPGQVPLLGIASGPDGNIWYTAVDLDLGFDGKIGRITPSGDVTEFKNIGGAMPCEIVAGPDGNLWFTECNVTANAIDRITPAGVVTRFPLPTSGPGHFPLAITRGPDGDLWFTEPGIHKIGRITTTGVISEFPVPDASGTIAAGSDGRLWFTEENATIGRLTTDGQFSQIDIPGPHNFAFDIKAAPDGNLWFAGGGNIGRVTMDGQFVEFDVPTGDASALTPGPDGNIWFSDREANTIGRLNLSACAFNSLCLGGRFQVTAAWEGGGRSGTGTPATLTLNTGYFWFFDASNVEVFVKILDACGTTGKFNVYVNGLTHLGVTVTVTDIRTGASRSYANPDGAPFSLIFDGSSFACP